MSDIVTKIAFHSLNHGFVPPELNETFLVLIPKKKKPKNINEY